MATDNLFSKLSDEELKQVALGNTDILKAARASEAKYSAANMSEMSDAQLEAVRNGTPISEIQDERNEFVGMGTSIGGALTGAAIGSVVPVIGTTIGGIVGGLAGAFGGELLEDTLEGKDLDYWNATKEASISLGIDAATFGTLKIAKPIYLASKEMLGFKPQEVAEEIAKHARETINIQKPFTQDSLASTQSLLDETGGKLTPAALPNATGILKFAEMIGRLGILSSNDFVVNMNKINDAVTGGVNELITKTKVDPLNKMELGQSVEGIFKEAKSALSKQYEIGLDSVMAKSANDMVDITPIYRTLDRLIKSKSTIIGNTLQDSTLKHAKDLLSDLSGGLPIVKDVMGDVAGSSSILDATGRSLSTTTRGVIGTETVAQKIPVAHLIQWEKKNKALLRELGNKTSPLYNKTLDRELNRLVDSLNGATHNVMGKVNNEAFQEYKAVKKAYAKGIEAINPKAIKNLVNAASKGTFEGLANTLLLNNNSLSKFKATHGALTASIKLLPKEGLENLGVATHKELLDKVKVSFLEDAFPNIKDVNLDLTSLAKNFKKLSPEQLTQARIVMGSDFGRFNQIKNAIIETAKRPESNFYALSLRSKETAAFASGVQVVGGIGAAAAASGIPGLVAGASVLLLPKILSRIALSSGHSARLINILGGRGKSKTVEGTEAQIALLLAEVMDTAVD